MQLFNITILSVSSIAFSMPIINYNISGYENKGNTDNNRCKHKLFFIMMFVLGTWANRIEF